MFRTQISFRKAGSARWVGIGSAAVGLLVIVGLWSWLSEAPVAEVAELEQKLPVKVSPDSQATAQKTTLPSAQLPVSKAEPSLPPLTPAEIARQQDWLKRYAAASTDAQRADVLSEAMASEDLSVRMALILKALQTGSQELKIEALRTLVGSTGQEQLPAFKASFADQDAVVRDAALQIARDQEPEVRLSTFAMGLRSEHSELRQQSFVELTREPAKSAMEILVRDFDALNAGVREQVWQHLLPQVSSLRKEPFKSAAEATKWWSAVSRRFDDHLNLTE